MHKSKLFIFLMLLTVFSCTPKKDDSKKPPTPPSTEDGPNGEQERKGDSKFTLTWNLPSEQAKDFALARIDFYTKRNGELIKRNVTSSLINAAVIDELPNGKAFLFVTVFGGNKKRLGTFEKDIEIKDSKASITVASLENFKPTTPAKPTEPKEPTDPEKPEKPEPVLFPQQFIFNVRGSSADVLARFQKLDPMIFARINYGQWQTTKPVILSSSKEYTRTIIPWFTDTSNDKFSCAGSYCHVGTNEPSSIDLRKYPFIDIPSNKEVYPSKNALWTKVLERLKLPNDDFSKMPILDDVEHPRVPWPLERIDLVEEWVAFNFADSAPSGYLTDADLLSKEDPIFVTLEFIKDGNLIAVKKFYGLRYSEKAISLDVNLNDKDFPAPVRPSAPVPEPEPEPEPEPITGGEEIEKSFSIYTAADFLNPGSTFKVELVASGQNTVTVERPFLTSEFSARDFSALLDHPSVGCTSCHNADLELGWHGVYLDRYPFEHKDGLKQNEILELLSQVVKTGEMPPSGPLSSQDMDSFQTWIYLGAPEEALKFSRTTFKAKVKKDLVYEMRIFKGEEFVPKYYVFRNSNLKNVNLLAN